METKHTKLEGYWWHRLIKVIFIVLSVGLAICSLLFFFLLNKGDATQYTIAKTFSAYLADETKIYNQDMSNCSNGKFNVFCAGGTLVVPASFDDENDLSSYSLGCIQPNGTIESLDDYSFKTDVTCNGVGGLNCQIPQYICNGDASHIVKYYSTTRRGFKDYLMMIFETLVVLVVWSVIAYLAYYKGLIYVIFGKET